MNINAVSLNNFLRVVAGFLVIGEAGLEYAKANGAALGLTAQQTTALGLVSVMVVAAVALLPRLQGDGFDAVRYGLDAHHVRARHESGE